MNDHQRFALHFGPYHAPPFHYGDVVMDEVRGEVTVVKLSGARIPWPIGKLRQGLGANDTRFNGAVLHQHGRPPATQVLSLRMVGEAFARGRDKPCLVIVISDNCSS